MCFKHTYNTMQVQFMKATNDMSDDDFKAIGIEVVDFLVQANWVKSKNEARRNIKQGAVKLNDMKVTDPFARCVLNDGTLFVVER